MELRRNTFKHAIAAGQLQIGLWCSLCSNIAADIVRDCGFDWLLLDTEHSPNEIPDLLAQLQAVDGGQATPIVRPAWNDIVLIKRCLDIGAPALLVPYVQNPAEAKSAVAAVRYPPRGVRGVASASRASRYGRTTDYLKKADSEICLLVQVETRAALDELEAIATVEGVDGVFIGPSDLSIALNDGRKAEPRGEALMKAAAWVVERAKSHGKYASMFCFDGADAREMAAKGFRLCSVSSDQILLRGAARAELAAARASVPGKRAK